MTPAPAKEDRTEYWKFMCQSMEKNHKKLIIQERSRVAREIEERFDYWEHTRGAYVLDQKYRDELKEFIFTGKSEGLGDFKELKKEYGVGK